jgi:uncharacterized membrane protein
MFVILAIVAGLVGTFLMSLVMWFIHERGWANADMIRAVGSMVTKRYDNSLGPGLLLHVAAGCLFALFYLLILRATGITNWFVLMQIGLALGTMHGAAMVFILMAMAEKHPLEQFRTAGPEVGWAHVVGHMAYGLGVGLTVGLIGSRIGELTKSVQLPS